MHGRGAALTGRLDAVKITGLETFLVPPRWLFLRIETDEGIVGWGEPVVEGKAATVAACVRELAGGLIGADPMPIEDHWQVLTKGGFYRGGAVLASAVSGIDQALWDIKGRAHGVGVHELLGGPVRQRVRVYAGIGGDDPGRVAELAAERKAAGFTALKMNGSGPLEPIPSSAATHEIEGRFAAARAAAGADFDIAIDFHGRFSPAAARRVIPLLAPYDPLFVEEPVLPELGHALGRIVADTQVPIATGERLYSRAEFLPVLQAGVAVVQPDLSHAGGISEVRRIAALAETFGAAVAPHCPLGPIALAACLQIDLATPNFLIQEQGIALHYNLPVRASSGFASVSPGGDLLDYLVDTDVLRISDGHIARLTGPGLGIEVDEGAVRRAAEIGHDWHNPVWRRPDGSFTEW